ncbi:MAG: sarcosine oxidase subunit gamma [Sphingomonadaceae bacterium]
MTEAALRITFAPARDVVVLDCWEGQPDFAGARAMRVEPQRWWLIDSGPAQASIANALGDRGALTPIGGGLVRATLEGKGWRAQLMIGGAFDAEDPGFGVGQCAATLFGHTSVWIDVVAEERAHVYFAASHLQDIMHLWGVDASSNAQGQTG